MLKFIWDILFPIQCLGGCGRWDIWLCPDCARQFGHGHKKDGHYYICEYKNPVMKKSIHQLKYGYSEELGKILGNLLKTTIDQEFDYVLPVPVHKKRRKERGFNQAELIAKQLPFPLNTGLKKIRHTKSQMTLKRKQRLTNLANSFAYENQLDLEGKKLLLVDDVYTTGATINEIKEMLEKYGQKEIWAATLAKGED